MKNAKNIFILGYLISILGFFSVGNIYASSGILSDEKTQTGTENKALRNIESLSGNMLEDAISSENIFTGKTLEEKEEDKVKQDINASIVEFIVIPKAKQIVKELSTKLTIRFPDPKDRIEAYKSIKNTLLLRRNRIEGMNMSNTGKYILKEFPNQMIELLDKKIEELQ